MSLTSFTEHVVIHRLKKSSIGDDYYQYTAYCGFQDHVSTFYEYPESTHRFSFDDDILTCNCKDCDDAYALSLLGELP